MASRLPQVFQSVCPLLISLTWAMTTIAMTAEIDHASVQRRASSLIHRSGLFICDPFIVADADNQTYYLYKADSVLS